MTTLNSLYGNGVKSIQRGTLPAGGTATISAVDTTKVILAHLGVVDASGNGTGNGYLTLTNATTISATSGGGTGTIGYQVVELF